MTTTIKNNLSPSSIECGAVFQTFCNINGQTVQDNMTITYTNNVVAQSTYNFAEVWNEIQNAMKEIHDLGTYGNRSPDITGLTDKQKDDYTTLEYYNDLLTRINKSTLSGTQYITALNISNLKDNLNNYILDSDRCNNCNNSCEYCNSCQTAAQTCGSCYSGEDCGQGSGCDGTCCMSGPWGCRVSCQGCGGA